MSGAVALPLLLVAGLGVVIHPFGSEVRRLSPSVLLLERCHQFLARLVARLH